MKWSVLPFRKAAPLLLLALSACSSPSTTPLLVDSELGQPLADTRRSGDTLLDRQRDEAPKPRVQHPVTNSVRGQAPAPVKARNPLGDQPVQLNFVDADIQAVVQRQYEGVVRNHDQIRDLRNRLRATA